METKRYSDSLKTGNFLLEISFDGSNEAGKNNPESTNVILHCLDKSDNEIWSKSFGNIPMPDGAWNGSKFITSHNDRYFVAAANKLMEVSIEDGQLKWEIATGNTPIYNVLLSEDTKQIIVQNGYYEFDHPTGMSNIAAYSFDGQQNWRSELEGNDIFCNRPYFEKGELYASTWACFNCRIDEKTGRILSRQFTK